MSAGLVTLEHDWLVLRWRVTDARGLLLPRFAGRRRADGLWRTTCFELFIRTAGDRSYQEWNLSPSQAFAAYAFSGTRRDRQDLPVAATPVCTWRGGSTRTALFDAAIPRAALPAPPWEGHVTAVLEEQNGVVTHWAVVHPAPHPDFHDPACFAPLLAAPRPA
ncbi:hypothetical protein EYB45_06620 [Erythrobacteraceae bacterium CFH 75059]|uniref:hypothetical protein n=1 Tax=Qipengyuania thermophila TaxID=2509361 RepID=UPI0010210E33|nr:hypothetical protein [Qipengyuania thermophila]TCD05168.1 hypothetical protein EYB45_06620 [Erythrobacteraceae bacterium CFH 75059]